MSKPEILQMGPYPKWDEDPLSEAFVVHRYFEVDDKAALLANGGANIRAIATRGDIGASADVINALPNLEVISVFGVGFDAVDLDACRAKGVKVTNTPDVLTKDVADLAIAMMLAKGRAVVEAENWVRSGDWKSKGDFGLQMRLHGLKAGVLGLGRIGFEIARRLAPFDMDIGYSDRA
ncbi:MAG: NAD(P)-dependent oxidoreductase, partial [Pseudomonadota bacterium]